MKPTSGFSDYIVYVDESGDHGLTSIDPHYPLFVLVFCIFRKDVYRERCTPALQALKFKHFGHDMVVLHERDIRQAQGAFSILVDKTRRADFMGDLNTLIEQTECTLIASAINKTRLQQSYNYPANPYDLALEFCLERLWYFLKEANRKPNRALHVVFEGRGKKEDHDLELAFRRVCDGNSLAAERFPFEPIFAPKQVNCGGLQIADLVARPIGRHILDPEQENRAYETIKNKFRRSPSGDVKGWGLKVFP